MASPYRDPCPICHAIMSFEIGEVTCPHCGNALLIGNSDPGGHTLGEIDPDLGGANLGVFSLNLHPPGTQVCVSCTAIYPATFECCPGLVDLAFASYLAATPEHGPRTDERIAAFLRENFRVAENTAQLRALEHRDHRLDRAAYGRIHRTLEELGLLHWVGEFES